MDTLAIVFAILTVAFVIDLGRMETSNRYETPALDLSALLALGSAVAAVVFGVLAAGL